MASFPWKKGILITVWILLIIVFFSIGFQAGAERCAAGSNGPAGDPDRLERSQHGDAADDRRYAFSHPDPDGHAHAVQHQFTDRHADTNLYTLRPADLDSHVRIFERDGSCTGGGSQRNGADPGRRSDGDTVDFNRT